MSTRKILLSLLLTCCFAGYGMAQTITGQVVDKSTKESLPGASITVVGKSEIGTTAMADGKFTLNVPGGRGEISVSFIGYKTVEVTLTQGRTNYLIELESDALMLEETVIVGYGTQKKENLTGAVTSVDVNKFVADRPVADIARALQGAVPGLVITSSTGELGSSPTIRLRGQVGSPNGSSAPLIIVDNVVITDLNFVNPEDIETISVLKDAASTSIFGARAAFGVILITTKSKNVKAKTSVTYSTNFAWRKPTTQSEQLSGWKQAEMTLGSQRRNSPGSTSYTMVNNLDQNEASIVRMKEWEEKYGGQKLGLDMEYGRDFEIKDTRQYYYRTWDWKDMYYKNYSPQQTHNLTINSSTDKSSSYIGLGYLGQDGLTKINTDTYDRYSVNLGTTAKVYDWLTVKPSILFSKTVRERPFIYNTTDQGLYDELYYLNRWQPFYPYGTFEGKPFRSSITEASQANRNKTERMVFRIGGSLTINIMEGLAVDADFNYSNTQDFRKTSGGPVFGYNFWDAKVTTRDALRNSYGDYATSAMPSLDYIQRTQGRTELYTTNAYATYLKKFNDHSFKFMAGTNIESSEYLYMSAKRMNLLDENYPELKLAYGDQTVSSEHSHWSVMGFVGRINYDYKGRYLFEANARYDGSSSFPTHKRWGFFPSVSAGWRISEESFMKSLQPVLSSLKLRGSYGSVGNQESGGSAYRSSISMNSAYGWLVNGLTTSAVSGSAPSYGGPTAVSPNITWETVTTLDFGFDARFFSNALGITFDVYNRTTSDLQSSGVALPATFAISAPSVNYGELQNRGWELAVDYTIRFKNGIKLGFGGQLADNITEVTKWSSLIESVTVPGYNEWTTTTSRYYKGRKVGDIWGYKVDRLFQDGDFVGGTLKDGIASQTKLESGAFHFGPGDVKYKDLDGNGEIYYGSNNIANHGDKTIIGNVLPRYQYGFTIDLAWKGFDFNAFFQGVGKRKLWVGGNIALPGFTLGEPWYKGQEDYWTPENTNAFYPRLTNYGQSMGWNYQINDRYLLNMAYLRCKSLSVGYTFPKAMVNKLYLSNLRVYISGENLFEFTPMRVDLDPETGITSGNTQSDARNYGRIYSFQRAYSFGLQVTF